MIPKRINHRGTCVHAQTPYARRKCRAARIAAASAQEETKTMRHTITILDGRWAVLCGGQPMGRLYSSTVEDDAQRMADSLNASEGQAIPAPPKPGTATGWSKAAARFGRGRGPATVDVVGRMLGMASPAPVGTCHYCGLSARSCDCG